MAQFSLYVHNSDLNPIHFIYFLHVTIYRRLRIGYDISQAVDWSRWPSRPIRSLQYIATCTIIRVLIQRITRVLSYV